MRTTEVMKLYMRYDVFRCFVNLLGGTVHLVCRNKDRADEARTHIVEQSKNEVKRNICIICVANN